MKLDEYEVVVLPIHPSLEGDMVAKVTHDPIHLTSLQLEEDIVLVIPRCGICPVHDPSMEVKSSNFQSCEYSPL